MQGAVAVGLPLAPHTRPETCGCISTMNNSVPSETPQQSHAHRAETPGAAHTYAARHGYTPAAPCTDTQIGVHAPRCAKP